MSSAEAVRMPLYEYECEACRHRFEKFVRPGSSAAADGITCPECQGQQLRQLLSSFAVSSETTRMMNREHGRKLAQKDLKEERVAEIEHVKEHWAEKGVTSKKPV
jgi:putative FmdB family regulatory protein